MAATCATLDFVFAANVDFLERYVVFERQEENLELVFLKNKCR